MAQDLSRYSSGGKDKKNNTGNSGLDALKNPFLLPGRFVKGAFSSVDDIARGLFRMVGAPISDVVAQPLRGIVPGGQPGWWRDPETGAFKSSTWEDLIKPIGQSMGNTASTLNDLTGGVFGTVTGQPHNLFASGKAERFGQRLQELNDDPFFFTLEHVGNVALFGSAASRPAQLGVAARRGAIPARAVATGLRPLKGRAIRTTAREAAEVAAAEGSKAAKLSILGQDVIGHPYRSAARKVKTSTPAALFRDPSGSSLIESPSVKEFDPSALGLKKTFEQDNPWALKTRWEGTIDPSTIDMPLAPLVEGNIKDLADSLDAGESIQRPVKVQVENGQIVGLVDGNHRWTAAIERGIKELSVEFDITETRTPRPVPSTDPVTGVGKTTDNLGPIDKTAQALGHMKEGFKESPIYKERLAPDTKAAKQIALDFRQSVLTGAGEIAKRTKESVYGEGTVLGKMNAQRKWNMPRTERLLLRDLRNLSKREDAGTWINLINDLDLDRVTPGSVPGRVKDVVSGKRAIGHTLEADDLVRITTRVIEEAKAQAGPSHYSSVLKEMLPGVDPMALHVMALHALEKSKGLPTNSLTNVLSDWLELDKYAEVNRRAEAALHGTEYEVPSAEAGRFKMPEEELGIDLNAMPEVREILDSALDQYRYDISASELIKLQQGIIGPEGARLTVDSKGLPARLASEEPTRFPTELEDLNLDPRWRDKLHEAERERGSARGKVAKLEERLNELESSGRPTLRRDVDQGVKYNKESKPTKASMDRTFKETSTGKAIKRTQKKLIEARLRAAEAASKLEKLEAEAAFDPSNAPATARVLLRYGQEVAPKQAAALRQMAADGFGDPQILESIAKDLEAVPQTLADLNSADVYLAYLRDMKDSGLQSTKAPAPSASDRNINTRAPKGATRRRAPLDIDFSRDFKARAYWQDVEFQKWFMSRQADAAVRAQGLAKSGRDRLKEAGHTEEAINKMTPGQAQQALERAGMRAYQPDQLFGVTRKHSGFHVDPLEEMWITGFVENSLGKAFKDAAAKSDFEKYLVEGVWDPLINTWKVVALPLRPAWQINNVAGGSLLSMLVGKVSPFDYPALMRSSYKAVRDWNRGLTNQIRLPLKDSYRADLVRALNLAEDTATKEMIQGFLDEGEIVLSNEVLNDIFSGGHTRGDFSFLTNTKVMKDLGDFSNGRHILDQFNARPPKIPGKAGEIARNWRETGKEMVDFAYHVNETVDNMHRVMVYLDQMGKGASHEAALGQVVKSLGDYNKLSPFERNVVKRVYPFWPWMRHMLDVVSRSTLPENINRSVIFAHVANIMGTPNEWEEDLPEWARGHIFMGEDENGVPQFLSTRGLNPFLDVFDPLAQPNLQGLLRPSAPPIQMLYEQMSGVSTLTGKPFTSPGIPYGSRETARPPVLEQLARQVPQLGVARDISRQLRGEPLTRYGTGEAAYFEQESPKTALHSVRQMFGYNVRPLDVEGIAQREFENDLRKQEAQRRYEQQREQYEKNR